MTGTTDRHSITDTQTVTDTDLRADIDPRTGIDTVAGQARRAALEFAAASTDAKDAILRAIGDQLTREQNRILDANAADVHEAETRGISVSLQDRIRLTPERIGGLVAGVEAVAGLADPIGAVRAGRTLPNGLRLSQVSVPLGVIGVIYEARPNVSVDIAALALKSGNSVILRGGSAAQKTNAVLVDLMRESLLECGFDPNIIQSIDHLGRAGADELMKTPGSVDVLIPRGGRELIRRVVENSRVPVIETGEGNVHIYLDATAEVESSVAILLDAKVSRPSVCNAVETLLIHTDARTTGAQVLTALHSAGVALYPDDAARSMWAEVDAESAAQAVEVTQEHFATEFNDLMLAVGVVESSADAIAHIRRYSTGHTEAIVTDSVAEAESFLRAIDAAAVVVNASTRFTDGGEFGLGAEVGISTQKLHARGPMGISELTSSKWIVRGDGHIRG